jgi:hypothetical protein
MVRQIEIRVSEPAMREKVLQALQLLDENGSTSFFLTEFMAVEMFVIVVHCYSYVCNDIISELQRLGCGAQWGYVTVISVDAVYPRLDYISDQCTNSFTPVDCSSATIPQSRIASTISHRLNFPWIRSSKLALSVGNKAATKLKKQPKIRIDAFKRNKKTIDEIYSSTTEAAKLTLTTWILLVGSAIIAASGFGLNGPVSIVASMLISVRAYLKQLRALHDD